MNDFNKQIDRKGTSSLKWDWYGEKDVIPLWVADMDFRASDAVIDALHKRIDHGIFGYTLPSDELYHVLMGMVKKLYGWDILRQWIVILPGVVSGLNISCRAVGQPGDDVMVPVPVYPPFFDAPKLADRNLVTYEFQEKNGRLTFDFPLFEKSITPRTRLFLFCTPQNPGGTVFRKDELRELARICEKHNITICSDEIHCGLVLDGKHIPTAAIDPEIARRTITLMSPSKTYNIPGMGFSFAVIPDDELRTRFQKAAKGIVPEVNVMGYTAAIAAYRDSEQWLEQLLDYLRENRELVLSFIEKIPGLRMFYPESMCLAWIDARAMNLENPCKFFEEAGVGLSDGRYFGKPGFVRLNFGCHRELLKEALERMASAVALTL